MKNHSQFTIRPRGLIPLLAVLALCQPLAAADYYVSPDWQRRQLRHASNRHSPRSSTRGTWCARRSPAA